jgi:hypothetical protein
MIMPFSEEVRAWVDRGKRFALAKEAQRRIQICRTCPEHAAAIGIWCKLCGCNMELKTHLAQAQCPADPPRWQKFI